MRRDSSRKRPSAAFSVASALSASLFADAHLGGRVLQQRFHLSREGQALSSDEDAACQCAKRPPVNGFTHGPFFLCGIASLGGEAKAGVSCTRGRRFVG